jgi:hypothetical protein
MAIANHGCGAALGPLLLWSTFNEINFDHAREGLTCQIYLSLGKSEVGAADQGKSVLIASNDRGFTHGY